VEHNLHSWLLAPTPTSSNLALWWLAGLNRGVPFAGAIIMASMLVSYSIGCEPPIGAEVVSPRKTAR
jgi:hypothetical protein